MKIMGMAMQAAIMLSIAGCLVSVAYADEGTATFYTPPYVPSACYGYENKGVMIAAASDALWNNKAACGRRYRVTCTGATNQGVPQPCTGASVVVTIVDYCPPGCQGTIDLSKEAFSQIADPNAGKIRIQYTP
ncbi:hypothetical protein P3X46_031792 [Hevea brasiliensis]|uniref:Expansin-like EG45 domain-containing protein n=2 Tax=Hevea brasiliensis TaxID=3981 RepID=A0ABQ9K7Y0_HEVBR|nr:hypothetical protein P3X46_034646 [Hevea brasiliensis]KAJ9141230.1 hypothetical protein P3X46_031792 [Hevea brasiliensis]